MFLNGGNNAGGSALGKSSGVPTSGYKQQFGATGTLQDEDDSGDEDDEEDIGKDMGLQERALDYESDEKSDEGADGASQELISLDGSS